MRPPVVFPLLALLLTPACGSKDGSPFATAPGATVLIGSATEVAVESVGGGFAVPPPSGAACDPQKWRDDIVFSTGVLSWRRCQVNNAGVDPSDYVKAPGSRTLTQSELADLRTAIDAVQVSSVRTCGADKPTLTLTVFEGSDHLLYVDDFYGCLKSFSAFVTSPQLDALVSMFTQLVGS
jgi:hypothetical protein